MNQWKETLKDFQGCISIKRKGGTVFEQAFGYSDLSNQISNTLDTRFGTASAGKVFVAVGILKLIEEGRLNFEDTMGELLDFELNHIDPLVTVEQLLNHTSGIPDYFDESIMEEYSDLWRDHPNYKIRTSRDLLPLFINKPMMYERGEKFQYNNSGYVMLGLIIESITKVPFDSYLADVIFKPGNMEHTGYYELDRLPAGCANAYLYDQVKEEYYTNIYSVDVKGTGAGGAYTTIGDIELFWNSLLGYKLLSEEMTNKMLRLQSTNFENEHYGYGIWLKKMEGYYVPYIEGCDPGVSFISSYDREEEVLITLVSNFGNNVWKLKRELKWQDFI